MNCLALTFGWQDCCHRNCLALTLLSQELFNPHTFGWQDCCRRNCLALIPLDGKAVVTAIIKLSHFWMSRLLSQELFSPHTFG